MANECELFAMTEERAPSGMVLGREFVEIEAPDGSRATVKVGRR